ncbi:MAG TPA: aldehyde dehydrogenase family protein, partial [Solirubrobacteraceae bacterium]
MAASTERRGACNTAPCSGASVLPNDGNVSETIYDSRDASREIPVNVQPAPTRAASADLLGLQRHYIAGEFRESVTGATFTTHNPATNEPLAEVADGAAAEVDAAVAAARKAFDEGPWPRMKASERAAVARRISAQLRARAGEFIEREILDIGMPVKQMQGLAERAAQNFDYYAEVVAALHGRAFEVGDEFINYTVRKPAGVAALIMPWNAPLMLTTWRL